MTSVHFEWVLDTAHGADYFRRWHRDKAIEATDDPGRIVALMAGADVALSNAFGFGGVNASVVLKRWSGA